MKKRTIELCGKQVEICYCAATEQGYEIMSGKSIQVFFPTYGKDEEGKDKMVAPPEATTGDYMMLGLAGIFAAYGSMDQESPITQNDVLYHIGRKERDLLITTIVDLRNEWYDIPSVVKKNLTTEQNADSKEGEKEKN